MTARAYTGIPIAIIFGRATPPVNAEDGDDRLTRLILGEVEDLWDMVALAEYPSLAAFRAMAASPEYRAIEHHRSAGLAGQLNIRTKPAA